MTKRKGRSFYARSASLMRWLHIYLSMVSFTALLFFAVTGITLNHPTWLGADKQSVREASGEIKKDWLEGEPDQLEIAEHLRSEQKLSGRVVQFEVGELDCMVVFKSPGYAADIMIDRQTGKFQLAETSSGWVSIMNDLHKGRDSGYGWSILIDVSAIMMILVSISGFALLFYLKLRRAAGLLTALAGTILFALAWCWLVP